MSKNIRGGKENQGSKVKYYEHGKSTNHLHPAFCLRYLDLNEYGFPTNDTDKQIIIIGSIYRLSQKTWQNIIQTPRNRGGRELIRKKSISKLPRMEIAPDENYVSFYIGGNRGRMIGCRRGKIFYILWFDFEFTLYKHS